MSKISPGMLLLAIAAVLFGLLGAYAVRLQLRSGPEVVPDPPGTVLVPTASIDLPAGRTISLGDVAVSRMTREQVKAAGITGFYMNSPGQIVGRVVAHTIPKGSTFRAEMLYPEGVYPDLSEQLQPGLRAVTIHVEGPAAVAGFARPGTTVDVLFRADAQDKMHLPETTLTIVEGAKVLALNERTFTGTTTEIGQERRQQLAVTLAVRPEHASAIRIVEGHGGFSLLLRHPEDDSPLANRRPRMLEDVLGLRLTDWQTDIYRRGQLSREEFFGNAQVTPLIQPSVDAMTAIPDIADGK